MKEMQERLSANLKAMEPDAMIKAWLPTAVKGFEQWQDMFASQMSCKDEIGPARSLRYTSHRLSGTHEALSPERRRRPLDDAPHYGYFQQTPPQRTQSLHLAKPANTRLAEAKSPQRFPRASNRGLARRLWVAQCIRCLGRWVLPRLPVPQLRDRRGSLWLPYGITPQGERMTNMLPRYREIAPSFLQWPQRWSLEMAVRSGLSAPDAPHWELDDPRSLFATGLGIAPLRLVLSENPPVILRLLLAFGIRLGSPSSTST